MTLSSGAFKSALSVSDDGFGRSCVSAPGSDAGLPASNRLAKNLSFAAAYRIADARLHPQPAESVEKLCLDGAAVPLQIPASYGYRRFPHTAGTSHSKSLA